MNVAIPHWRGRVSPVFDVAGAAVVVELVDGAEASRRELALHGLQARPRAAALAEAGVELLICGAVSRPMALALSAEGIEVVAQTCGDVEEVLAACRQGRLRQDRFRMPGGCGRGAGRRCRRRRGQAGP
jgi:predicted Fe-Mo cluster-binding NifX family protein